MNMAKLGYAPAWKSSSGFVFCHVTPCGKTRSLVLYTGECWISDARQDDRYSRTHSVPYHLRAV